MPKSLNPKNVYELLENDEGEIMLLIYAGEKAPQEATFALNEKQKNLELYRNDKDRVIIDGLAPESIAKLKTINILYVCEMKYNEIPDGENKILYAYPATLKQNQTPIQEKEQNITEKAKQAREKVLKKEQKQ